MQTRCSFRRLMMVAVAIFTLATAFSFGEASAQCSSVTIINNSGCTVRINLVCPGMSPILQYVPAHTVSPPFFLPATCNPLQVEAFTCGNERVMIPRGCVNNLQIDNGCCTDICYDPIACTITVTPAPGPCPCV